eukprot:RCo011081
MASPAPGPESAAVPSPGPSPVRPSLGAELACEMGPGGEAEFLVRGVSPGGPFDLAGVLPGDVLEKWGNTPLTSLAAFEQMRAKARIGGTDQFQIRRTRYDGTIEDLLVPVLIAGTTQPMTTTVLNPDGHSAVLGSPRTAGGCPPSPCPASPITSQSWADSSANSAVQGAGRPSLGMDVCFGPSGALVGSVAPGG